MRTSCKELKHIRDETELNGLTTKRGVFQEMQVTLSLSFPFFSPSSFLSIQCRYLSREASLCVNKKKKKERNRVRGGKNSIHGGNHLYDVLIC